MTRRLTFALFLAAAYLSLVNLDRVGLWSDEAINRNIGATLLATGDIKGWDGRNLTGGTNGRSLNAELRDTFPPLSYPVTGLSVALFGDDPGGARVLHALLGLAGLAFCHMFLRQVLGRRERRLLLLTFAFIALSADLSLFFRQARYYSLTFLALFAMLYGYERFRRTGRLRHYLLMAAAAVAGFFSHYASGAAAIAALACWHLLLRGRATSRRDHLLYAGAGLLVAVPGAAYLGWLGVLGSGFSEFSGTAADPTAWHEDFRDRLFFYPSHAFRYDWLPYIPLLWYAVWRYWIIWRQSHAPPGARAADRLLVLGALYLAASCLFSVQPLSVMDNKLIDSRYFFCVIPMFALLKALLADWLWTRSRWAGGAALAAMLLTNATSYPFNVVNKLSRESTFGPRLLQHAVALHQPYGHPLDDAIRLLDEHAEDGDLVYAPDFFYREAMAAANGDRFIYCCHLDPADERAAAILAKLPESQLGIRPQEADWHLYRAYPGQLKDELMFHFEPFAHGEREMRYTQSPEPDRHVFHSPANQFSFVLLKKRRGTDAGELP